MPKVLVLHHFYYPDDVAAAAQFTGLCEGLASKGWEVEVWPSNRACHSSERFTTKVEKLNGVDVHRVWRPGFPQHRFWGRILNSIWMLKAWWWRLSFTPGLKPDVILLGTDPLFCAVLAPWLKLLRPKARIAHWCFDLYPEAAVADGIAGEGATSVKVAKHFMGKGYRQCDLVANLGPCMAQRLKEYSLKKLVTLTPWSVEEPEKPMDFDAPERQALFGDAPLGLLYSGSFGRAHEFYLTLKLARMMREQAVFAYGVRGSRLPELQKAVNPEDRNVRFAPFAPAEKLAARLSAPDVHLVSLRAEWTGVVVPSKFFGALAAGRPVLFEGDKNASMAEWIKEYGVGWVLNVENLAETAEKLLAFSKSRDKKKKMFQLCHETYQAHFSKKAQLGLWDVELRSLSGS